MRFKWFLIRDYCAQNCFDKIKVITDQIKLQNIVQTKVRLTSFSDQVIRAHHE